MIIETGGNHNTGQI